MRYIAFSFIFFILASAKVDAQDSVETLLLAAKEFYQNEKYEQASQIYLDLIDGGHDSKDILFNLGTCFYHLDKLPESILYYEKLLKISPSDKKAVTNLRIVNDQRLSDLTSIPDFFLLQWWRKFSLFSNPTLWSLFSLLIFGCSLYFFYSYMLLNKSNKNWIKSLFFLLIAGIFFLAGKTSHQLRTEDLFAINLGELYLLKSPDVKSKQIIKLIPGEKLEIMDELGDWFEVNLINKESGWVRKSEVEVI